MSWFRNIGRASIYLANNEAILFRNPAIIMVCGFTAAIARARWDVLQHRGVGTVRSLWLLALCTSNTDRPAGDGGLIVMASAA